MTQAEIDDWHELEMWPDLEVHAFYKGYKALKGH